MFRRKCKKILLVAPDQSLNHLFRLELNASVLQVYNVNSCSKIFTSLFEKQPDAIVFDYDFLCKDAEHVLRRIRTNSFYNRIKIYCYRNEADEKIDSFLKILGVDTMIYKNEIDKHNTASVNFTNNDSVLKYLSFNIALK